MILREKIQIVLIAVGLFSVGFGLSLQRPGRDRAEQPRDQTPPRVGFWKDFGMSQDHGRTIGPWLLAIGAASLVAAYVSRER